MPSIREQIEALVELELDGADASNPYDKFLTFKAGLQVLTEDVKKKREYYIQRLSEANEKLDDAYADDDDAASRKIERKIKKLEKRIRTCDVRLRVLKKASKEKTYLTLVQNAIEGVEHEFDHIESEYKRTIKKMRSQFHLYLSAVAKLGTLARRDTQLRRQSDLLKKELVNPPAIPIFRSGIPESVSPPRKRGSVYEIWDVNKVTHAYETGHYPK